ncbi:hypothetical protein GCM10011575_08870 [Microlunatus endophyticus]|uniref:Alpha/beta hydrolase family protein n=1 Tax=Microlunatus endophyticus TaxID=1716077 RepID=A0A917S1T2_9ACTN|nr:alpha/beta hydrolase [Microlunatus endophyticus]GGL52718.1 hypothetical protein GCM10011575_08870 [Microlunatus endophyticus]
MDFSTSVLDGDDRHAVLLPGGGYPATAPLLWYTAAALSYQGWTVHLVTWPVKPAAGPGSSLSELARDLVRPVAEEIIESLVRPSRVLVAGKSLGSLAMPLAVERGLPGIWLTPVLTEPKIADTARRLGQDHLLIGGTADPLWDSTIAAASGASRLEVPDADHSLQVEADLQATLAAIVAAAHAVDDFARALQPTA